MKLKLKILIAKKLYFHSTFKKLNIDISKMYAKINKPDISH